MLFFWPPTFQVSYNKTSISLNNSIPSNKYFRIFCIIPDITEIKKSSRTNGLILSFSYYPVLISVHHKIPLPLTNSFQNLELPEATGSILVLGILENSWEILYEWLRLIHNLAKYLSFHTTQKSFPFLQWIWPNPQFHANFVTFTKEILNAKLHFLCSVNR